MKAVIIGGTGLIGSRLSRLLRQRSDEVVQVSRSTGVNIMTGEGLADVLAGADVLVDTSNSPSFDDEAVMSFFKTSTPHLLRSANEAGVSHYVALSVVGADRMTDHGYMRAKAAQEALIRAGGVPYTIVRATQFFEFVAAIADSAVDGDTIRLPGVRMQPIAADDVAAALARVAASAPLNGTVDIAGPQQFTMDQLVRRQLIANGDARPVRADPRAHYYGGPVDDTSLVPTGEARLGTIRFEDWLHRAGLQPAG